VTTLTSAGNNKTHDAELNQYDTATSSLKKGTSQKSTSDGLEQTALFSNNLSPQTQQADENLAQLNDLYTNEWADLDKDLAQIVGQRDYTLQQWGNYIQKNPGADAIYYQKMNQVNTKDNPLVPGYSGYFISESFNIVSQYFKVNPGSGSAYLEKISDLLDKYKQMQAATNATFYLNTTNPATNAPYYQEKIKQRRDFYNRLNELGTEINSETRWPSIALLNIAKTNFEIYIKKDEINDKINQKNAAVRARNLLRKPLI
jgi:hypothetical protein